MKANVNVKGVSNRENRIVKLEYEYPDKEMTLKDFLSETVRITVEEYNKKVKERKTSDDVSEFGEILKTLSNEDIDDMAVGGKISFGINYGGKKADLDKAIENALVCFADGMIAVFIDNVRYEDINANVPVKEGSEITFVRLTFLSGRMW